MVLDETTGAAVTGEDSESETIGINPQRHPQIPPYKVPEKELDEDDVGAIRKYQTNLSELSDRVNASAENHALYNLQKMRDEYGNEKGYIAENGHYGWLLPSGTFLHNGEWDGTDGTHTGVVEEILGNEYDVRDALHDALHKHGWIRYGEVERDGPAKGHPFVQIGHNEPTHEQRKWLLDKAPENINWERVRKGQNLVGGENYRSLKVHLEGKGATPRAIHAFLSETGTGYWSMVAW
jgi:hypothetical protein